MTQENIKITLPNSKLEAEIKSYLPHKVVRNMNSLLLSDTEIDSNTSEETLKKEFKLNGEKAIKYRDILVYGMVVRIGDKSKKDLTLDNDVIDELSEEDFETIAKAAEKVKAEYDEKTSPKE